MPNKSKNTKRRTKVKDLPKSEKELTGKTMKKISGGFLGGVANFANASNREPNSADLDPSRQGKS